VLQCTGRCGPDPCAAAKQWHDRGRPRGLLWRDEALVEYQLWRPRYPGALGSIESAFAAASVSEAARGRRIRNIVIATVMAVLAIGLVVLYRASSRAEEASGRAHQRLLDLNVEQGRQALLAKDPMRALAYLSKAYSAGARGPDLGFMIARATADLDTQRAVLDHGPGQVRDVAFSADGATIVSAGSGGARVWTAATGALQHVLAHKSRAWAVAVSPDGSRAVTGSGDKTAVIWDLASGRAIATLPHPEGVYTVRLSPDGRRLATACQDNVVRLWDAATGALLAELAGHSALALRLAFDASGRRLLSVSADDTARLWDAERGTAIATLAGHTNWVVAGQFSPDGKLIATASIDRTARLWDAATGQLVRTLQHFHPLGSIEWSPDGSQLVTASEDHRATLWKATGEPTVTLLGHTDILIAARFSPNGKQVLTYGVDGTARLWDAITGAPLLTFVGHTGTVQAAAFDARGTRIVTGSSDGSVRIWDARSSPQLAHADGEPAEKPGQNLFMASFALDRDGNVLVASRTGEPTVRSIADGRILRRGKAPGDASFALLLPDGRLLAIRADGVRVADASLPGTRGASFAIAARDARRIVLGYKDRPAELWEVAPPRRLATLSGARDTLAAAFDPDGRRIVTAHDDGVRVWDATGRLLRSLEGKPVALYLAWSPDGRRIAGAGPDKTARIWSADDGRQLAVLQGHIAVVSSVAFHPDGVLVATTSPDETAKIWNSVTGAQLASYTFLASVGWATFSPDGTRMLTVTVDETDKDPPSFQVWDVATDRRGPDALAEYVRCRVPLAFDDERLVPKPTSCR
jgi:WD40 repeat protein